MIFRFLADKTVDYFRARPALVKLICLALGLSSDRVKNFNINDTPDLIKKHLNKETSSDKRFIDAIIKLENDDEIKAALSYDVLAVISGTTDFAHAIEIAPKSNLVTHLKNFMTEVQDMNAFKAMYNRPEITKIINNTQNAFLDAATEKDGNLKIDAETQDEYLLFGESCETTNKSMEKKAEQIKNATGLNSLKDLESLQIEHNVPIDITETSRDKIEKNYKGVLGGCGQFFTQIFSKNPNEGERAALAASFTPNKFVKGDTETLLCGVATAEMLHEAVVNAVESDPTNAKEYLDKNKLYDHSKLQPEQRTAWKNAKDLVMQARDSKFVEKLSDFGKIKIKGTDVTLGQLGTTVGLTALGLYSSTVAVAVGGAYTAFKIGGHNLNEFNKAREAARDPKTNTVDYKKIDYKGLASNAITTIIPIAATVVSSALAKGSVVGRVAAPLAAAACFLYGNHKTAKKLGKKGLQAFQEGIKSKALRRLLLGSVILGGVGLAGYAAIDHFSGDAAPNTDNLTKEDKDNLSELQKRTDSAAEDLEKQMQDFRKENYGEIFKEDDGTDLCKDETKEDETKKDTDTVEYNIPKNWQHPIMEHDPSDIKLAGNISLQDYRNDGHPGAFVNKDGWVCEPNGDFDKGAIRLDDKKLVNFAPPKVEPAAIVKPEPTPITVSPSLDENNLPMPTHNFEINNTGEVVKSSLGDLQPGDIIRTEYGNQVAYFTDSHGTDRSFSGVDAVQRAEAARLADLNGAPQPEIGHRVTHTPPPGYKIPEGLSTYKHEGKDYFAYNYHGNITISDNEAVTMSQGTDARHAQEAAERAAARTPQPSDKLAEQHVMVKNLIKQNMDADFTR
jgi:hypothetical protein